MIFSCENCQAKFDVDPERIKDGGSKVRCSQCKHVFTIYKPAPEQAEWDSEPSLDFEDETVNETPREEVAEREPELTAADEKPAEEEEPEDDLGLDDFGPTDMDHEEDSPGFDEAPGFDDDLGLDDLGLGEPEDEPGEAAEPGGGFDDDLGFEDLGFEPEDQPVPKSASSSHGVEDLEDDLGLDELGIGETDDIVGEDVDHDDMEFGHVQDDMGIDDIASNAGLEPDEEDWEAPPVSDEDEYTEEEDDLGLPASDEGPAVIEDKDVGEPDIAFLGADDDEAESIAGEFAPPLKGKKRRTPWFLIIILLLVAGLAGIYLLAPQLLDPVLGLFGASMQQEQPKSTADPSGNQKISPEDAKHFFRQNESEGQLLVITGLAKNQYDNARSYIRLKGLLHDAKGKVLAEKMVYCGNILSEEQLMSMSMADIDKALNVRDGENGANTNVPPGGSVQFMVVFSQIPNDLAEYTVEVFSSQPAQKKP